ncbi:MAG: hypothetical protein R3C24_12175 [Cyanobacteriota/Melainabacteria group bacterium]
MPNDQTKISDEQPQVKNWSAPELYLSQSEAQAGKASITAADLADIRQSDVLTGQIIEGKYRILDLIGEGAMAIVYEALDLKTNRRVAAQNSLNIPMTAWWHGLPGKSKFTRSFAIPTLSRQWNVFSDPTTSAFSSWK